MPRRAVQFGSARVFRIGLDLGRAGTPSHGAARQLELVLDSDHEAGAPLDCDYRA